MRFFFDNCISSNLVKALALLTAPRHSVEHLTERFPSDALDIDWIPKLASDPDVILVSGDPAITTSKKERAVWRQAGITSFFFASGFTELHTWNQVCEVVNWWQPIVDQAKIAQRGSGYLLPVRGFRKPPKCIYSPNETETAAPL